MRSNTVFGGTTFKLVSASLALLTSTFSFHVLADGDGAAAAPAEASAAPASAAAEKPLDTVKATPKGKLKNPYQDTDKEIVEQGRKLYMRTSCNGCHGGSGGGGMCPPLSNETWVYGGDDDTLFRLISEGTDALQKDGYARKGRENVVGPMPPHGAIVKSSDDLWKIITFIRSNYRGSEAKKYGDAPATN
ncbi:c-type cytochrome [Hydrocarboniphaga effusa]|jgi:mono/diheme cytochrome c family protein|uniref:c-type cytochrome n=1 Tax=Hydrocarboniphaga effusa TaxID=243629 RepID=UPI003137B5F1